MVFYNVHTHSRKEGEISVLNISPEEYDSADRGYISCGVHPWYVEDNEVSLRMLQEIAQRPNVVAIGETGFDSQRGPSLKKQKASFEKHIELSEYHQKPLIIHCVKAWDWLLASHKEINPKQTWIIHGFRGKPELMYQLLEKEMKFSIGAKFNEETVKNIPLENLFFETDDSNIKIEEVYTMIAKLRDFDHYVLVDAVKSNVESIFRLSNCY